jgi:valyl-tRNA synthetase
MLLSGFGLALGIAKINTMELSKTYNPMAHEADIYKLWEESGAFKPEVNSEGKPFSIIMPPPNANGDLHLGHAMYVVEDIMIRYHRMKGDPTLWLPGVDHAGIETQVVFERQLEKAGKSRFDLGREEFYRQVMAFTQQNRTNMENQLKSLGFSCDWTREKFTLDTDIINIVYGTFRKLHDDGLIYRGNRIVNWCPRCRSGFADIEIKHRDQIDPLYYIKYGPFVLATVRPETKFGDTAVAVHPDDERYKQYVGKEITAQGLLGEFKLKVIADLHVDPAFGTGAVKVTPAHDPNDWEIGQRHHLEVKQAIGTDGRLTSLCGKYAGMPTVDARVQVAHDLEERGLMDHIDMNYKHAVAIHDRCGTVIEPLVTEQWWLKVKPLVEPAIKAVESGEIKIIPSRFKKVYIDWLSNLRDWNISRQDWWGMRIPVYYRSSNDQSKQPYLIATNEDEAREYYGEGNYEAETDIFDTWFSSSQWPFATLMATGDFELFYPTSVMETGRDILFLWVTRMVMLGLYRTGEIPFKSVYLHGMVNDHHGKKMSKSKGNVISPLSMTEKYGTDALRLALTIGITPGNDGSLSEQKIEGYRNFCNKLWNVARYVLAQAGPNYTPQPTDNKAEFPNLADRWILERVSYETSSVSKLIESYRFSEAGQHVYSLLWDDFADWYIETSKITPNPQVLVTALETILKLAHPFAPFVTEVIWQKMPWQKDNLIVSPWPDARMAPPAKEFKQVQELVRQIRLLKADLEIKQPALLHQGDNLITTQAKLIQRLAGLESIKTVKEGRGLAVPGISSCWLDIEAGQAKQILGHLLKRQQDQSDYRNRLKSQLSNDKFVRSAPAPIVADAKDRLAQAEMLLSKLDEQIHAIKTAL